MSLTTGYYIKYRPYLVGVFVLFISIFQMQAQDSILSFRAYMQIVEEHHPFVFRGDLFVNIGDAKVLKARGAFDPKIESDISHKHFDDKNYFTLMQGGLTVPLIFGSDLKVKFDRNNGVFLNNSDFVPQQGLLGPGLDFVLGRGLFTDERRTTLRQSKLLRLQSTYDREILVNDIMYKASLAYFDWQKNQLRESLIEESIDLAEVRFNITKESFFNGYAAAVDTLEAIIELQSRQQMLLQVRQDYENSRTNLGNFLWMNGMIPLEIEETLSSESLDFNAYRQVLDSLAAIESEILTRHPVILSYDNKIDILEIERKLNRENLKPELVMSYSPLIEFDNQIDNGSIFMENYKLGAFFSYPIFTRKERADLRITGFKIQDAEFERVNKIQKIQNNLEIFRTSVYYLLEQFEQIRNIRINSRALLDAENQKFRIGESSVFLVNAREQKYIEARDKEIQIQIKIQENISKYLYTLNEMQVL